MKTYFELRERLTQLYPSSDHWRFVAHKAEANMASIAFDGSALTVWTNILNALRTQNRLQGLVTILKEEDPASADLANRYAEDVARGAGPISDIPELHDVQLAAKDKEPGQIVNSLGLGSTLTLGLLELAMADIQPSTADVDRELKGVNTAAAKATAKRQSEQTAQDLSVLKSQIDQAEAKLRALESEIKSIESAREPTTPVMPVTTDALPDAKNYAHRRYQEDLEKYTTAKAKLAADRTSLPGLRAEANDIDQHIAQQSMALSNRKAAAETQARDLEKAIAEARDKDMLLELDRTMDRASEALHRGSNTVQGFGALLGAGCLLSFFENILSFSAATEAGRKFSGAADVINQSVQSGLAEIARGSLAGPLYVREVLAQSHKALAALTERLNALPLAQMEERRSSAEALLSEKLPSVPDSGSSETEAEIEARKQQAIAGQAFIKDYAERLQQQINREPAELRDKVRGSLADAETTLAQIHQAGEEGNDALTQTWILWDLIGRGAANSYLPVFAHRLCVALPQEFSRRAEADAAVLLADASDSDWGLKTAQEFVQSHLLSRYHEAGEQIQARLSKSKKHLDKLKAAEGDADDRYREVVAKYRGLLYPMAFLSALPLVGPIWGIFLVNSLTPIMASSRTEFVELGSFALRAFAGATAATFAMAAIAAGLAFYPNSFVAMSDPVYFVGAAAAYALSGVLCLINLVRFRKHQKPR